MNQRPSSLGAQRAVRLLGIALAMVSAPGLALDLGKVGAAADTVQRTSGAVTAGQQAMEAGRTMADQARARREQGQQGATPTSSAPSNTPTSTPSPASASTAPLQGDQGGPRRVIAVLGDAWTDSARRGQAAVALMDQGPYFVQRQAAHVASTKAQWLATPRGDSTSVVIDLPGDPEGTTYDLATGQARPGGRGVRIFALSVHTDLPQRTSRRSLDAIEQHAMLRASSVRTEWPRQAGDILEATGGKLLVWASDATQRFPSGFGADGRLFTSDDPMVTLPRGYTVVTLDAQGLRFDRGREAALSLHPVQPALSIDLSRLSAGDALQALASLVAERHPHAASAKLDAAAMKAEFGPRMQAAADRNDSAAQAQLLADLGLRLRDAQYRVWLPGGQPWPVRNNRGLSPMEMMRGSVALPMPRTWLRDDGKLFVTGVEPASPAAQAGLQPGSEILSIEGETPQRYLDRIVANTSAPQDVRRGLASPLDLAPGATLSLRVRPPDGQEQTLRLGASPTASTPPLPVAEPALAAFMLRSARGNSYAYIALDSFADAATGQLDRWERALASAVQAKAAGLVIDLRPYRGDDTHQLLPHMLATLYTRNQPLRIQDASQRMYDPAARVWRSRSGLGIPSQLGLAVPEAPFTAPVAVLVSPQCTGPCELFASWLQHSRRAEVIGTSATAGSVGQSTRVHLPGGLAVQLVLLAETGPAASPLTPRLRVPVDAAFTASVQAGGDPLLDAAVLRLEQMGSSPASSLTTSSKPHSNHPQGELLP